MRNRQDKKEKAHDDELIIKAMDLMQKYCLQLQSVKEVADLLDCNYNTLRAKFWRSTGMSMETYLQSQKLKMAVDLLAQSDLLVKQVAIELGYKDEATFVRQFKKHFGITPGTYQMSVVLRELLIELQDKLAKLSETLQSFDALKNLKKGHGSQKR